MKAAADDTGSHVGSVFSSLGGKVTGVVDNMFGTNFSQAHKRAQDAFDATGGKAQGLMGKLSSLGGAVAIGAAVGIASVAAISIKSGLELEDSQSKLNAAIKASGENSKQWQGQIGATQQHLESLGFSNAQVNDALAASVVSTQNVGKSLQTMGLAADLARFKHTDLTTATEALDKALTGNLRPLKQLGIDLPLQASSALKVKTAQGALAKAQAGVNAVLAKYPDAAQAGAAGHAQYEAATTKVSDSQKKLTDLTDAHSQILDALTQRLKGQASAAANTFGGKVGVLKTQFKDVTAHIGQELIPILMRLMSTISSTVTWFEKHKTVAMVLAGVIGGVVVAAIVAYTASMVTAAASTIAAAAPVLLVIGVLAALGVAAYEIYKHWGQIWGEIKRIAADFWHWLDGVWHNGIVQTVFLPIRIEIDLVKGAFQLAFDAIRTIVMGAWTDVIQPVAGFISNVFNNVVIPAVNTLGSVFGSIFGGLQAVVQGAWNGIKLVLNVIIGGINDLIGGFDAATSWIPGVPNIPKIKKLAAGGPASAGNPYLIGELGPELFVPNVSGSVIPNNRLQGGGSGSEAGPLHVSINVNGDKFAEAILPNFRSATYRRKRQTITMDMA